MARLPTTLPKRLALLREFDSDESASRKLAVLRALARSVLSRARDVRDLHDTLCFLRAYPDDGEVLAAVEKMLAGFSRRRDLVLHRDALADSGIAGTWTYYAYYWFAAQWLVGRWPEQLVIDWEDFDRVSKLEDMFHLFTLYAETPALDEIGLEPRAWLERLKSPRETDAGFLLRRFGALAADSHLQELFFEELDVPIGIEPGPDTPSRTRAKVPTTRVHFQRGPLTRSAVALREAAVEAPRAVRSLSPSRADVLIELAREVMISYSRDLLVFMCADRRDVRVLDFGHGVEIAFMCAVPERRLLLESVYGFIVLKNGVPIGYGSISALFGSAAVAYNVFPIYRGGESAAIFGHVLSAARTLFGADSFMLDPYQLGHDNEEGLSSGAWWFYYKLGFRPHDPGVRRILRRELQRMKARPRHRSSVATLSLLTAESMFFYLDGPRRDVLGRVSIGDIGLRVVDYLARRFGSDREEGERVCQREAASLLGVRSTRGFTPGERLAWRRWSPLIMSLRGVSRWPEADKAALVEVVRAKGGRDEADFVVRFDAHTRLRRAILRTD